MPLPQTVQLSIRPAIFNQYAAIHGVLQLILKYVITDYSVKGTDLFTLRLSNKRMSIANITIAVRCE